MIICDFETRSRIDLKKVGTYKYARDPSTAVLCLAWWFDDEPLDLEHVRLWHPAIPERVCVHRDGPLTPSGKPRKVKTVPGLPEEGREDLERLFERVRAGETLGAWNAFFERCIWEYVAADFMGWPAVRPEQWRCSAALAASYALPRKLEHAGPVLRTSHVKDMDGNRLMLTLSKPAKPTVTDSAREWITDPEKHQRNYLYCRRDVLAEAAIHTALVDMPAVEIETWRLDQEINHRGVAVDVELCHAAVDLGDEIREDAADTLKRLTNGKVTTAKQNQRFKDWLRDEGVEIPTKVNNKKQRVETLEKEAMAKLLATELPPQAREALEAWKAAGKSSTAKYVAALERVSEDGRVRDILKYHAASTGRWAGQGIQPQNFPRGYGDNIEDVCSDIKLRDLDVLETLWGPPLTVLADALRGMIVAPPGHDLLVSDYSAIEARGTFYAAQCEAGMAVFAAYDADPKANPDIYQWQAAKILEKPWHLITKYERQVYGKVPVLGCGYQMGGPKLQTYAAGMGVQIDEETAKALVANYRQTFPEVVDLWYAQERAAHRAVRRWKSDDRRPVEAGLVKWAVRGRFLYCVLPSGRRLAYLDPRIERRKVVPKDKDKEPFFKDTLVFTGMDTYTHRWGPCTTYGGKLVENIVQAMCRDLLRDAMLNVERRYQAGEVPYRQVLTVHDEIVAEVPEGEGSVEELEALMEQTEPWAGTMPVKAEGWRGKRYKKG